MQTIRMTKTCAGPTSNRIAGKTYRDVDDDEANMLLEAGAAVVVPPAPPPAEENVDEPEGAKTGPDPAHAEVVATKAQRAAMEAVGATAGVADVSFTAAKNAIRVGRSDVDAMEAGLAAAESLASETMGENGWWLDKRYSHERWVKPRGEAKAELDDGGAVVGYIGIIDGSQRVGDRFETMDAARVAVDAKLDELSAAGSGAKETTRGKQGDETTKGKGAKETTKPPPKTDPNKKSDGD